MPSTSIALLALLSAAPLAAQDWPQFRGPSAAGRSDAETIPTRFELDDANWRVELPGRGHSSPVVHGGRIVLTCEDTDAGVRTVVCLRAEDGEVAWVHEAKLNPHAQHRLNCFASSTPAVDDDGVYVTWTIGSKLEVFSLDWKGELRWRRELGSFQAQHGSGSSPIVYDGVVIVASDNEGVASFLVGLDAATGESKWNRERKSVRASYSTPLLHAPRRGAPQVIFASTAHGLTSLHPKTGELHWEIDGIFEERCVGTPVLAGDILFVAAGSGGGGKESVAVELGDQGSARIAWRSSRALPYVPTPVAVGEHMFLWNDGGIVSCIDPMSGDEVWRERVDGKFFGSPIAVGDRLYAMSTDGALIVIAASDEFENLAKIDLGEPTQATPAVADGVMYLRTETQLLSVGGSE